MKSIHVTAANVARRYSISDTAVHYKYLHYLDIRPLPLPEIISVNKVFLYIDYRDRYALIMMDIRNYKIIDILASRWEEKTSAYILCVPLKKR